MININNEIMTLNKVLLHRPGDELLNMMPNMIEELLYSDIPYLKTIREEHDEFARILTSNGVQVIYLEDLITEVLDMYPEIREKFIKQYVYESEVKSPRYKKAIINYLNSFNDNKELVLKTISGISINELSAMEKDNKHSLLDSYVDDNLILIKPMPNLIFVRDIINSIGSGVCLNKMKFNIRDRESIYLEYILTYHDDYKNIVKYNNRYSDYSIFGGDIINLNKNTLIIGISNRTSAEAIEELALNIFNDSNSLIDTIIAMDINDNHLDEVFNQVDYDKFLYYPSGINKFKIYEIKADVMDGLKVKTNIDNLENIIEKYLKRDIILIPCGGGDKIIAAREQYNSAINVLCIAPGIVISYDRNNITNAVLRRYGVKVIEIPSSELSRGKGGPMSMCTSLIRKDN